MTKDAHAERFEEKGLAVATEWKRHWQEKEPGYFDRAFNIDANMRHHLGKLIAAALCEAATVSGPSEEEIAEGARKYSEEARDAELKQSQYAFYDFTRGARWYRSQQKPAAPIRMPERKPVPPIASTIKHYMNASWNDCLDAVAAINSDRQTAAPMPSEEDVFRAWSVATATFPNEFSNQVRVFCQWLRDRLAGDGREG